MIILKYRILDSWTTIKLSPKDYFVDSLDSSNSTTPAYDDVRDYISGLDKTLIQETNLTIEKKYELEKTHTKYWHNGKSYLTEKQNINVLTREIVEHTFICYSLILEENNKSIYHLNRFKIGEEFIYNHFDGVYKENENGEVVEIKSF